MRFLKGDWARIADGEITVAFRRWKRATVVAGRPYRTGGGRIEVISVTEVDPAQIDRADAKRAGAASLEVLREWLDSDDDKPVFRVEFRLLDEPDPRAALAQSDQLTAEELAEIDKRLDRLDRAGKSGPWTRETLQLIAEHPEIRAADLAAMVGRETEPFKLDVRKLKNLGLTLSLSPGYRLSPRGEAYWRERS